MTKSAAADQLVHDLWKETAGSHSSKREPDVYVCKDITDRLSSIPLSTPLHPTDARRFMITLSSILKTIRVLKRSNTAWMPIHESLKEVFDQFHKVSSANVSPAVDGAEETTTSAKLQQGVLPQTVHEYHMRLQKHKKELYKNPPVLPPHSICIEPSIFPLPKRHSSHKTFEFVCGSESDASTVEFIAKFRPNRSPEEILRSGAFGGTYFRPINSSVTNESFSADEALNASVLPEWISGLDVKQSLTSTTYRTSVNKYGVKCGGSLGMWESSGWISNADPYGWFQWYCRFFQGRRCNDDGRQISRWLGIAGSKGRFRMQLLNKIIASNPHADAWNDATISPVIRQTLLHWGLSITREMVQEHLKLKRSVLQK